MPCHWLPGVARTFVLPEFELGQTRPDHWPTALEFCASHSSPPSRDKPVNRRPEPPDVTKADLWSAGLLWSPPVAWHVNVDDRAHNLTLSHRSLMFAFQLRQAAKPRQLYVNAHALLLVRFRRGLRHTLSDLAADGRYSLLRVCFSLEGC